MGDRSDPVNIVAMVDDGPLGQADDRVVRDRGRTEITGRPFAQRPAPKIAAAALRVGSGLGHGRVKSRAKYVRIRSAPARLNAVSVSCTTRASSIAPAAAANLIIAYSPLT